MNDFRAYVTQLIADDFFDHPISSFDICESHTGYVMLTGACAYKFRKRVRLPYHLDYSTPALRGEQLRKEITLNAVFGHDLYRAVYPIYQTPQGRFQKTPAGPVIDYVLQMRELPQTALLTRYLSDGHAFSDRALAQLAATIARFHDHAPRMTVDPLAGLQEEYVWVLENLPPAYEPEWRARHRAYVADLPRHGDRIRHRATQGFIRDGHGDLRADNCFYLEQQFYPFDRVEFYDPYRWRDVASDLAALMVDFALHGHASSGSTLLAAYAQHDIGHGIQDIIPFYLHFRALLMTSVHHDLAKGQQGAVAERTRAKSDRYWAIACRFLDEGKTA